MKHYQTENLKKRIQKSQCDIENAADEVYNEFPSNVIQECIKKLRRSISTLYLRIKFDFYYKSLLLYY
jgi:hypothetical protein